MVHATPTPTSPVKSPRPGGPYRLRPFTEAVVERALNGDAEFIRPCDRHEAGRRLIAQGLTDSQIAERLRCSRKTAWFIRQMAVAS